MQENSCNPCPMASRIEQLEKDNERNANTHRIFYDKFEQTALAQARNDERLATLLPILAEIKEDVKELKDKPNKRWELIVAAVISVIIGGLGGAILRGVIGG